MNVINAPPPHQIILNQYQQEALDAAITGRNLFITGPAGSGKSTLIASIVRTLQAQPYNRNVAVTALTGCAAILIGIPGTKTLHSWAGVGLGTDDIPILLAKIKKHGRVYIWRSTNTLIIDEVSMMSIDLLTKLDAIGRTVRHANDRPFGGMQVIMCGDFYQLPPITQDETRKFIFESPIWHEFNLKTILLRKIERQSDDIEFQKILNDIRVGYTDVHINKILQSRMNLDWKSLAIRPTLLFSLSRDVNEINRKNIEALKRPLRTFKSSTIYYSAPVPHIYPTYYTINQQAKQGGIEIDENNYAECKHIVNRPGFDRIGEIELKRIVAKLDKDCNYSTELNICEGAQVMLITNLIAGELVNGSRGVVIGFANISGYPIIEFINNRRVTIGPHDWFSTENAFISRRQIPLVVAYAVTIHKCQGATIDRALVDIGNSIFEYGQAYVALSRVKNLNSLYIHNYNPKKIKANQKVYDFYYDYEYPYATPAWNRRKTATIAMATGLW